MKKVRKVRLGGKRWRMEGQGRWGCPGPKEAVAFGHKLKGKNGLQQGGVGHGQGELRRRWLR